MNYIRVSVLVSLLLVLLLGCSNNIAVNDADHTIANSIPSLPDQIELHFGPLTFNEIDQVGPSAEWELHKSIPFGRIAGSEAVLDVLKMKQTAEETEPLMGVLKFNRKQYFLPNISESIVQNDPNDCSQVCVFQRYFANQDQYEFIGSVDISLNGPGLKTYIVYDETNDKVLSFDLWGEPSFIDLDGDGNDELVIEFEGLHNHRPDLSIIRSTNGGLELSTSIFDNIPKNQGDYAVLNKDADPPIIRISNVESENELVHDYSYTDGVLKRLNE